MASRRLPESAYNWTTVAGALLAVASFSIILLLLLIDLLVHEATLYLGMLTFVVLPVFLILGLLLIPVGMLRARRQRARGKVSTFPREFHVDLAEPASRNAFLIFVGGTALFLIATAAGSYKAYKQTESVEFCGTLCHAVMHPEYTAYQLSPHARVACAECHIGEGADWYVKSKLSGAYQVYATLTNDYPRPIPTPVANLRPARETCEECHWPEKFFAGRQVVNPHFLPDEENTPYPITMLLKIGGASEQGGRVEGIHWHVARSNHIQYIARDEARLQVAWVRLTDDEGRVVEYTDGEKPLSPEERAAASVRQMDCIDCHNRPSHKYKSPNRTVNEAITLGQIDRRLPYIKQQAVTALDAQYPSTSEALQGIEKKLVGYYEEEYPEVVEEQGPALEAAVAAVQRIYQQNFFPEMKVTWRQYPDHIGHSEFIGCFRCHGSALETADGKRISKDCDLCHVILVQGTGEAGEQLAPGGLTFAHPEDIGGDEFESNCTECHEGGAEIF